MAAVVTNFLISAHTVWRVHDAIYVQKDSTRGLWLEAREGLLKMLQEIPLSDEERAAVDGDVQALDQLLQKLATVPTPSAIATNQTKTTFIPLKSVHSR